MKARFIFPLAFLLLCATMFEGCAPQIKYLNVDVRKNAAIAVDMDGVDAAIFSVVSNSKPDSMRVANVAIGFAEQLESDRQVDIGSVPVYSIKTEEYMISDDGGLVPDKDYISSLYADTGSEVMFFINKIQFLQYSVERMSEYSGYDGYNVSLPYVVGLDIFDCRGPEKLYGSVESDTLYLFVDSSVSENNVGGAVAKRLPYISKIIGAELAKSLSPQWVTQNRMLISYETGSEWEDAYMLAEEFQWKEAIDKWMQFAGAKDSKKAAFAAYNIAVGCEMLEQFELALKWIDYSIELFPMKESEIYRRHLEQYR